MHSETQPNQQINQQVLVMVRLVAKKLVVVWGEGRGKERNDRGRERDGGGRAESFPVKKYSGGRILFKGGRVFSK